MVFRNFLGNNFFSVAPPPVRNDSLVVFWPVLGPGHREEFRAQAKNRKRNFQVLGVPKRKGSRQVTTLSGMVVRNFLAFYAFADRTPTDGRAIARYEGSRPFWSRTAVGT